MLVMGGGGVWLRRRVAAPGRRERKGEGGREGWDGDGAEIERRARAGRTGSSRQEFPPNARDLGAGRQAGSRECKYLFFYTGGGGPGDCLQDWAVAT